MGAGGSRTDFSFHDEFTRWSLVHVKAALGRFQAIKTKARATGLNRLLLLRREFWEVFNDYSVITETGAFLSLPLEVFTLFVTDNPNAVFAYELFSILALFCQGTEAEKIEFCFRLFDLDSKNALNQADLVLMLQSITSGARKVGLSATVPSSAELFNMANDLLTRIDRNKDEEVSLDEFEAWAKVNTDTKSLLSRFAAASLDGEAINKQLKKKGAAKKTAAPAPAPAAAAAGGGGRSSGAAGSGEAPRSPAPRRSSRTTESKSPVDIAASGAVRHMQVLEDRVRQSKLRLIANKKTMLDLQAQTNMDSKDMETLLHQFSDASNVSGVLPLELFEKILKANFPSLAADPSTLKRLFAIMDSNGDGHVDFREFALGFSQLFRGSVDSKLGLIFKIYDVDGSGSLTTRELSELVKSAQVEVTDGIDFALEVVNSMHDATSDTIPRSVFVDTIKNDTLMLTVFCQSWDFTVGAAAKALEAACPGFNRANVVKLIKKTTGRAAFERILSTSDAVVLFRTNFGASTAAEEAVEGYYAAISGMTHHVPTLFDLLRCSVLAVASSQEDEVGLFFDLMDFTHGGALSADDIVRLLVSSRSKIEDGTRALLDMLSALDKDGDNRITQPEFEAMARRDQVVMSSFEKLFKPSKNAMLRARRAT